MGCVVTINSHDSLVLSLRSSNGTFKQILLTELTADDISAAYQADVALGDARGKSIRKSWNVTRLEGGRRMREKTVSVKWKHMRSAGQNVAGWAPR